MTTIQQVVDRARIPLNDDAKARYTDAKALEYANAAIDRAYQIRPDLRIGTGWTDYAPLAIGVDFPLPYTFVQPVADYITGRMNTIDDEAGAEEKAAAYMALFEKTLT